MIQWMAYEVIVTLILSAAALSADRALRLRRATTRWVWVATLIASLVIPALIASVSIQVPNITTQNVPRRIVALRDVTSLPLAALSHIPRLPPVARAHAIDSQLQRYWLVASGTLLLLLAASATQLLWRKRRWARGTVAGVRVYVAPGVGPAVVGLIRPCIVVPPWVVESPPSCQAIVIAHEQSHLAARDPLLLTTALCLLVFMPWNLPLWWQVRHLRRAIEIDCDARVLRAGHDVTRYGETLIEVGQRQSVFIGTVAAMSESRSFLEQRIRIMITKPRGWWKMSAAALGCSSLCLIAVAAQVSPPNSGTNGGQTHEVVPVDPTVYDDYVGHYRFAERLVMTVSRDGNRLLTRLTGQNPVEIFPSSNTEFFAKIVNAQITFETDAQGHASALILHQNGDHTAPRMDDQVAQQIEDAVTARVQGQTPSPGTAESLRRYIDSLEAGKPNYGEMSPQLAAAVRRQLPMIEDIIHRVGTFQFMMFKGVGQDGMDVYDVTFEHGQLEWRIAPLSSDGRVLMRGFHELP